jgi:hypothetical protein
MKMNDVKSATWSKLAEIKTTAKTPKGIYNVLCEEFGVDFCEDVPAVLDAISDGNIQICEDGIIVWGEWKEK